MSSKKKPKLQMIGSEAPVRDRVISAMQDKNYKFRTVRGISKSAKISPEQVMQVIANEGPKLVISSRKSSNGESLYTTREHYKESATWTEKLMGVVLNRVY